MGSVVHAAVHALATDAQPVVTALNGWFGWLEDKGMLVGTRALKEKALKDVAAAMEDPRRAWNWRQEAANVAVQHQEACSPRVMSALMAVADRASLWQAFGEFVLTATSADHIRQVAEAITGVSEAQSFRPAWAAQLQASVLGLKARPSEAKRSRDRRDSSLEDSPPRSKSRRESRRSRARAHSPPNT